MTEFLIGGYSADLGGIATGLSRGRSRPDGTFEYLGTVAECVSPSWLLVRGDIVVAALECRGELASFRRRRDTFTPLGTVSAGGSLPCHLEVTGDALLTACYGDGTVSVHEWTRDGVGALRQRLTGSGSGPLPDQEGPHAHSSLVLGDGRVLSCDLGADRVYVHHWAGEVLERIGEVVVPAGSGPRDLLALSDGRVVMLGQHGGGVFVLEPSGEGFEVSASGRFPGARDDDHAAGLALSADDRFLYTGLRGSNQVSVVELAGRDAVRPVGSVPTDGDWPRHLVLDTGALHVCNQLSSTIVSFRIGPDGIPEPAGEPVAVPSPTHLVAVG